MASAIVKVGSGLLLELSTPFSDEAVPTDFASLDGLADGLTAALSWKRQFKTFSPARGSRKPPGQENPEDVCRSLTKPGRDSPAVCDARTLAAYLRAEGRDDEFVTALRRLDRATADEGRGLGVSIALKAGYNDYRFFSLDATTEDDHRVGESVTASGYYVNGRRRLSLGFSLERAFSDQAIVGQKCAAVPGAPLLQSCESLPVGAPLEQTEAIVRAEFRHNGRGLGAAPLFSWRPKTRIVGFDLPIYFVKDSGGNLTGGLRLSVRSNEDLQLAVFVAKPLNDF